MWLNFSSLLILFHLLIIANAIFLQGGGGRGRGRPRFSSSWSSESHERPHPPRPHPPRPRPPPPASDPVYVCESGYMKFTRPQGDWCVRVGYAEGNPSQPATETICRGMGATLTGLQNSDERMKIANAALQIIESRGIVIAGLWLGAESLPGCKNNAACGALGTYRWTDGHTTGTDGFKWGRGEPDLIDWPGNPVCIQQFIVSPTYYNGIPAGFTYEGWRVWADYFQNGDLDKYSCGVGYGPSPAWRLYACGKAAVLQ